MRHILISLILLLSFTGCQEKEQQSSEAPAKHDSKTAADTRAEVLAEFEAEKKAQLAQVQATEAKIKALKVSPPTKPQTEKEEDKLSNMGVKMDNDVITIDTNKTKTFLKDLSKRMEKQMKKISHDLDKGIIEAKEAGVDINNGHINIDLNKTQDLFESWSKKIQVFTNEFDNISKSLDTNSTEEGK